MQVLNQSGQAMTEFLVVSLALIPLFLIMPMIGKYQDMANATQMASRYVAFDATRHNDDISGSRFKTDAQLAGEVGRRFFSNVEAPIKTSDTAGNFPFFRNPLWSDTTGKALLADFATDVCVTFGIPPGGFCNGGRTGAEGYGDAAYGNSPYLGLARKQFDLEESRIYTGAVHVRVANVPNLPPLNDINLTMTRHTSLVPNAWTGSSVKDVDKRVEGMVPTSMLSGVAIVSDVMVSLIEAFQITKGPKFGDMGLTSDLVPEDRLCDYGDAKCTARP